MTPPRCTDDGVAWAQDLHAAWQEVVAKSRAQPWLLAALRHHGKRLPARFLSMYERLRRRPKLVTRVQRRLGLSLAGAALLLAVTTAAASSGQALPLPASAGSVIVVNQTTCTLAQAIAAANSDTAVGGCAAGSGADTIDLQAGVTLTAVDNSTYGPSGLPVITSPITIAGNGHTIHRAEAAPEFRILAVGTVGNLTLNGATVSGGFGVRVTDPWFGSGGGIYNRGATTVSNSTLTGNRSSFARGGGIYSFKARLEVRNSTISGNSSNGSGGGIAVNESYRYDPNCPVVELTVVESTVSGNTGGVGGGIYIWHGDAIIDRSTVIDNRAIDAPSIYRIAGGGGIEVSSSNVTITDSRIVNNTAELEGGGLRNYGRVTMLRSTVSGNSAMKHGGGLFSHGHLYLSGSTISGNNAAGYGGGIRTEDAILRVDESVITGNSAALNGGGISSARNFSEWDDATAFEVLNSTISGNSAGHQGGGIYVSFGCLVYDHCPTLSNSIVSFNTAEEGGGIFVYPFQFYPHRPPVSNLVVDNSYLDYNRATAGDGGGINNQGLLTVMNSTLSHNTAYSNGGGIASTGATTLANSTLSHNQAIGSAGGLFVDGGEATVSNSTLTGNHGGARGGGIDNINYARLTLQRSLISGNFAYSAREIRNTAPSVLANNFNLFGHSEESDAQAFYGTAPSGTDINATSSGSNIALDSILSPAAVDNGGPLVGAKDKPLVTHALPAGSPAIDKAPNTACAAAPVAGVDARAFKRNANGAGAVTDNDCDIGAFEAASAPFRKLQSLLTTEPPVIDGDLSDWSSAGAVAVDDRTVQTLLGYRPSNPDLSATVRSMWTPTTLFVAFDIRDNAMSADSAQVWQDDNAEFALDAANDGVWNGTNDRQYTLTVDGRKTVGGTAGGNHSVAARRGLDGWVAEMAIPFTDLGAAELVAGRLMGLNLGVGDDDNGGDRDTHLVWAGTRTWQVEPGWGLLELASKNPPYRWAAPVPLPTPAGDTRTLQEGFLGYNGGEDASIHSSSPTQNSGASPDLVIRSSDGTGSLLRFDLSTLPAGVRIKNATLSLYPVGRDASWPLDLAAHKLLRNWVEMQATWNLARSGEAWQSPGANGDADRVFLASAQRRVDALNRWQGLDLTRLVQEWVNDPESNRGLVVKSAYGNAVTFNFVSSERADGDSPAYRPELIVSYWLNVPAATSTPPACLVTPTPTPSPTATLTPSPTRTTTPTPSPTHTPAHTSTPSPTHTPAHTPSSTPTPSPTPAPSDTPSPTPSPQATATPTPSPTPSATPVCTDGYEDDDAFTRARLLSIDGPAQSHAFVRPGDVDWVKVVVQAGKQYAFLTQNPATNVDTVLALFAGDGVTELARNDDDPANPPASRIEWTAPATGTYFLRASNLDPLAGGCALTYEIAARSLNTPTPTPTSTPIPKVYLPLLHRPATVNLPLIVP